MTRATYHRKRFADTAAALSLARTLLRHDRWTPAELEAYQHERLAELVARTRVASAFYRRLYADVGPDDQLELGRLPVTGKAAVMEHFDELVTDPRLTLQAVEAHLDGLTRDDLLFGEYRAMATGGSTGRKGIFVVDRAEWRQYLAAFFRWNHYIGLKPRLPRRVKLASIAASRPLHMTYRMAVSVDVGLHRVLRLDATTPVGDLVEALNRYRPEFLYAYPSILGQLAAEQLDGRLRIAPAIVASSGETHTDELRAAIRAAWGTSSFELYAMTEAGIIGSHCAEHAGIHLFEDLAVVEVVDQHDRPVPAGQVGHKLLVTNLVMQTQPLLRYEVSDMVAVAPEPCPCGRPFRLLRGVEGRNDDILHLPAAAGGEVAVHPLALRSALAGIPGLDQYKVVHDDLGLHVRATLRPGARPDDTAGRIGRQLRAQLASMGVSRPEVDVEVCDSLAGERDGAGKFKLVEAGGRGRPVQSG